METNQTDNNTQLITELHTALNSVTALFVSFHGFEYACVKQALSALEKSARTYKLPVREILAQQIQRHSTPAEKTQQLTTLFREWLDGDGQEQRETFQALVDAGLIDLEKNKEQQ